MANEEARSRIPNPLTVLPSLGRFVLGRVVTTTPKQPGVSPGTVHHVGRRRVERSRLDLIDFTTDSLVEEIDSTIDECFEQIRGPGTTWIDFHGLHDVERIDRIGDRIGIHPLVREDIADTNQRAKVEDYPDHIYLVLPMLRFDPETETVDKEQVSLVLTKDCVFSFQERPGDVFDPVRVRLREARGKIRSRGPDYLAYALLDAVVDNYFGILEQIGDLVDELEDTVVAGSDPDIVTRVHGLKREMVIVRRAVWPLRELLSSLTRGESPLITDETRLFLRDVYDHAVQVIDSVESLRDVLSSTMDLHLSYVGNRMNEIMKVLTIMSTLFIPLSFLAGLYGMNFAVMPELQIPWGYPALLGVMVVVAGGMLTFFKRRGWLW